MLKRSKKVPIWTLSLFKLFILRIWFVVILKGGNPDVHALKDESHCSTCTVALLHKYPQERPERIKFISQYLLTPITSNQYTKLAKSPEGLIQETCECTSKSERQFQKRRVPNIPHAHLSMSLTRLRILALRPSTKFNNSL